MVEGCIPERYPPTPTPEILGNYRWPLQTDRFPSSYSPLSNWVLVNVGFCIISCFFDIIIQQVSAVGRHYIRRMPENVADDDLNTVKGLSQGLHGREKIIRYWFDRCRSQ
jgi:hypothetical protein